METALLEICREYYRDPCLLRLLTRGMFSFKGVLCRFCGCKGLEGVEA